MMTCFDWLFHKDITSESWRDDTGLTLKEIRSFMDDPELGKIIRALLSRDLGQSVYVEDLSLHFTNKTPPFYTIKKLDGTTLFKGEEAALVLMSVIQTGHVPSVAIDE